MRDLKGDALLLVDCVTSLGGIPVAIDDWGVDIAYSGTQKCLGVPPGLAPLTMSDRARDRFVERSQSWYLDLRMISQYVATGGGRTYHHTAPISMIFALHAGLGAVLDEGLEAAQARHAECGALLQAGLEKLGFRLFAEEGHRLPELTTAWVPDGVDEAAVRRRLLERYGIEIGGGLGAYAGKVWRIGCMGHTARVRNVTLLLGALARLSAAMIRLFGRRVMLRPLVGSDFMQWSEVRQRNREWLLKWEPMRIPGTPDPAVDREAFAVRCSARERERQLGAGYGFGIFVEGEVRRRDQPQLRASGPVPERVHRLLDRRGARGSGLHARVGCHRASLRLRGAAACTACRSRSSPATQPAGASSRSSRSARKARRFATSRSTARGKTTCGTR